MARSETTKCYRCGMTFHIGAPKQSLPLQVCGERKCKRRFWSGKPVEGGNYIRCYTPADIGERYSTAVSLYPAHG